MKVKITQKGVSDCKVGDVVELKGDTIPANLVNKCVPVVAESKLEVATPKKPKQDAKAK